MRYLDERGRSILMKIVDHPTITGKDLENTLGLSRKQLSYAIEKVNDYLISIGFSKIERLKTGKLSTPTSVIEQFRTEAFSFEEANYVYTDKERLYLIVLLLLCRREELSSYHFTTQLDVSKNTLLLDLKKIQTQIQERHGLSVLYSRKDGYTLIGEEYAKREVLIYSIRKVLQMPLGGELIQKFCNIDIEVIIKMKREIILIEQKLNIQFTDERLKELPYILCTVIQRVQEGKILETLPEAFQHIVGTREYAVVSELAKKYRISNQLEKAFLAAQIQISNIHYLKSDEYKMEKKLMKAASDMIQNFELICCVKLEERDKLLEMLMQHCKPAFYRMKYNYHIENSIIDMVLPQHSYLHEMVRKSVTPFEKLIETKISDDELVYLTVLFGAWLRRQGVLNIIEEKRKAVVVCANGVSVSNYLLITLKELFPEFEFLSCLSIRGFEEYKNDYDIVFSTVRIQTEKTQFLIKPFLNEHSKQSFREKVFQEVDGVNLHMIKISSLVNIIEQHASIHEREQLIKELNQYINHNEHSQNEVPHGQHMLEEIELMKLLREDTIQIVENEMEWQEAIIQAAKPLLAQGAIEQRYVRKMMLSIMEDKPFIMIADGVIIAHAGVDDGVKEVSMSFLRLPKKISIHGYMNADVIIVLATPDTSKHLTALYKLIEITESKEVMRNIRKAKKIEEIIEVMKI